jgi:hypothetical protein
MSEIYIFKENCEFINVQDPPFEQFPGLNDTMLPNIGLIK